MTKDELYGAKKGISSGLSYGINVVYATAIDEALEDYRKVEKELVKCQECLEEYYPDELNEDLCMTCESTHEKQEVE